jgi:hypothetical protein
MVLFASTDVRQPSCHEDMVFPLETDKNKALVSFEQDILERGLLSWLRNHTSFVTPSHRYEGNISLRENTMVLQGRDKQTNADWYLEVVKEEITDVFLGFDDVYRKREERSMGIAFQPLRVRFTKSGEEHSMYLLIDVNRWTRGNRNGEWFERINAWREQEKW